MAPATAATRVAEDTLRLQSLVNTLGFATLDALEDYIFMHGACTLQPATSGDALETQQTMASTTSSQMVPLGGLAVTRAVSPSRLERREQAHKARKDALKEVTADLKRARAELEHVRGQLSEEQQRGEQARESLRRVMDDYAALNARLQELETPPAEDEGRMTLAQLHEQLAACYDEIEHFDTVMAEKDDLIAELEARLSLQASTSSAEHAVVVDDDTTIVSRVDDTPQQAPQVAAAVPMDDRPAPTPADLPLRVEHDSGRITVATSQVEIVIERPTTRIEPIASTSRVMIEEAAPVQQAPSQAPFSSAPISTATANEKRRTQRAYYPALHESYNSSRQRLSRSQAWLRDALAFCETQRDALGQSSLPAPPSAEASDFPDYPKIDGLDNDALGLEYPSLRDREIKLRRLLSDIDDWKDAFTRFRAQLAPSSSHVGSSSAIIASGPQKVKKRRKVTTASSEQSGSSTPRRRSARLDTASSSSAKRPAVESRKSSPLEAASATTLSVVPSPTLVQVTALRIHQPVVDSAEPVQPPPSSSSAEVIPETPKKKETGRKRARVSDILSGSASSAARPRRHMASRMPPSPPPPSMILRRVSPLRQSRLPPSSLAASSSSQPSTQDGEASVPIVGARSEPSSVNEPTTVLANQSSPSSSGTRPSQRAQTTASDENAPLQDDSRPPYQQPLSPRTMPSSTQPEDLVLATASPPRPSKATTPEPLQPSPRRRTVTASPVSVQKRARRRAGERHDHDDPFWVSAPTLPTPGQSRGIMDDSVKAEDPDDDSADLRVKDEGDEDGGAEDMVSESERSFLIHPQLGTPPLPAADWQSVAKRESFYKRRAPASVANNDSSPRRRRDKRKDEQGGRESSAARDKGVKRRKRADSDGEEADEDGDDTTPRDKKRRKRSEGSGLQLTAEQLDAGPDEVNDPQGKQWLKGLKERRHIQADQLRAARASKASGSRVVIDKDKNGGVDFHYNETVRNKAARSKMYATTCESCANWYERTGAMPSCKHGASSESNKKRKGTFLDDRDRQMQKRLQETSRHRAQHRPDPTPPDYWQMGFPSTQGIDRINQQAADLRSEKREYQESEAKQGGFYKYRD